MSNVRADIDAGQKERYMDCWFICVRRTQTTVTCVLRTQVGNAKIFACRNSSFSENLKINVRKKGKKSRHCVAGESPTEVGTTNKDAKRKSRIYLCAYRKFKVRACRKINW